MRLIGTITPAAKPVQTLADLDDGVLATVVHNITASCLRFCDGEHVLGLTSGGQLVVHSHGPRDYKVVEVHGPLTFSLED